MERRKWGIFQDVLAVHDDLALRGRDLVQQKLDDRGLAGTGGADEEDELTLLDPDADIVQRGPRRLRIRLRHVLELNHGNGVYAV
jgi:hypothetical protein